jgi:chromosome segregation ATPase
MNSKILWVLVMLLIGNGQAQAGLSKAEKKAIKEELKRMKKNPESYKAQKESMQAAIDSAQAETKRLKEELAYAATQQVDLQAQVSDLQQQVQNCDNERKTLQTAAAAAGDDSKGTIFKVQLGLYGKLDVTASFEGKKNIGYEKISGLNRYLVGSFPTEEDAQKMADDLKKLGIKGAFVAKYENGNRIYEWEKNPKYKGKKAPASLEEAIGK